MEGGLINPLALIRTGAAKGVTSGLGFVPFLCGSPHLALGGGLQLAFAAS